MVICLILLEARCEGVADQTAPGKPAQAIALLHGFLINGTGAEPVADSAVVIENGVITAVGGIAEITVPPHARVYDVTGYSVLPGFFNAHVHGGFDADALKCWAQAGVTTVRDTSHFGRYEQREGFRVRDRLLTDNKNARLVAVGPGVSTVGGYGELQVSSPEDAREKIARLINDGADLVKIGIENSMPPGTSYKVFPLEQILAITETAHKMKRRVTAHVSRVWHVELALDGNVDDLAHVIIEHQPDEQIARLVQKNVYLCPTLEIYKEVSDTYKLDWKDHTINNLRRFVIAGGKVALGTDIGGYSCQFDQGMPMKEIGLMAEAGMTPMQIIVAATQNAAAVCDMADKLGTLEKGKIADVLVVKKNPLQDLNALKLVFMVIHNGEVIRREE